MDDTNFDDFIRGKGNSNSSHYEAHNLTFLGKGVIILLCGPPGVGKTLTAESGVFINFILSTQH